MDDESVSWPNGRSAPADDHALVRSVLIVKVAAIGDVVMALPMVSAIRASFPDARIAWLCGRTVAPLLRRVEGVDEVIAVDELAMLTGRLPAQGYSVAACWAKVAARRFDAVYIAHSDRRYRLLTALVNCREKRWLGGNNNRRGLLSGRTHTDEYVRLVTGVDDHRAPAFPYPRLSTSLPAPLERRLGEFNPARRHLVALTPGGARNAARESPLRRWPVERYAELAQALNERGYAVAITGGCTDGWVRDAFRNSTVLDLVGATDLPSLAAVLRECAVVVAHDSAPMHLARLVGTPVVALLGPTPPTMFFRPHPHVAVLWPGAALPCAPCYDGKVFAACGFNECMQMIDCKTVLQRVDRLLASSSSEPH